MSDALTARERVAERSVRTIDTGADTLMDHNVTVACTTGMRRPLLASVLAVIVLVAAACGGGDEADGVTDPPPQHVHGLGINPADGALYIATHTGLFRMEAGSDSGERVGNSLQDTMGFAVVGPDRFLGSGHPDLRQDLPPLLGLIRSDDAGMTWDNVSLLGKADFHALRVRGERIVGYDASNGRLMRSQDGGETWSTDVPPAQIGDLVVHPDEPQRYIASSAAGLLRSADDGRTWTRLSGGGLVLLWPERDALYGLTPEGDVELSRDGGASWATVGALGGQPAAATATDRDTLIVALHDGRIVSSADAGATWTDGAWAAG
jgi:hypothetical protein